MTNTELIELLREARSWVGHNLDCTAVCDECVVAGRIDAALAAHEAEERVEVEWKTDAFKNDYFKQGNTLSMVCQNIDGRWAWKTQVEGYANTESEAKAAAIAAARGMK